MRERKRNIFWISEIKRGKGYSMKLILSCRIDEFMQRIEGEDLITSEKPKI